MRVLICGGRDLDSSDVWNWLERYLKGELESVRNLHCSRKIECIIHGGARGADTAADDWAKSEGIKVLPFVVTKKDWENIEAPGAVVKVKNGRKYNAAAGPIRNQRMIDQGKPDVCIAFPGGSGTADMVARAESAGVPVIRAQI